MFIWARNGTIKTKAFGKMLFEPKLNIMVGADFTDPFFIPSYLPCASPSLHQNTSPKWLTLIFLNCTHDVIQVEQICTTCKQKWYTWILLPPINPFGGSLNYLLIRLQTMQLAFVWSGITWIPITWLLSWSIT